ncbi:hypothetical protein HYY69_03940 [Candidatus Woesearchaeota archaeon]|nr:hypothetical protein [Candidatus Woesearchaeota archaeon]
MIIIQDLEKINNAVKQLQQGKKQKITITLDNPQQFHNKLWYQVFYNKLIIAIQKKIVPFELKNKLLRTTGLDIGHDACIPHDITFDPYFPELIHINKGTIIGGCTTIKSHILKGNTLTLGNVTVGERTLVGGVSVIYPGIKIGKNAILTSNSELTENIKEGELWMGNPAKLLQKMSKEDLEKYFHMSKGNPEEYYQEYYQKLAAFKNDDQQTYFKMQYHGRHLNAGNDWWRARNPLAIFWSGILVELARRMNHSSLKTFLLKLAGAKIGKNVYIGKGVVLDHLMTNYITIEDGVKLEDDVYLDEHEYTISQTIFGRTIIKKGAHLKKGVFARAGTVVGEGTIVEENSFIQREIPAHEIWKGNPAKCVKKIAKLKYEAQEVHH